MKSTIISLVLKLVIAILECILKKYSSKNGTNYIQDVQINENASKLFSEFIKKHTVNKVEKE